jgi:hypothetical protein
VFYLFAEDVRGVVRASPLQRKKSLRANAQQSEILIYEIDEAGLNAVKKTVFLPEPYKQPTSEQLQTQNLERSQKKRPKGESICKSR